MTPINLNGEWNLYYFKSAAEDIKAPEELKRADAVIATVPGNVEVDMANAGLIGNDLYKGMATVENEVFEDYYWWYEKTFYVENTSDWKRAFLNFGGVDCFAEYYLNGELVHISNNAFMNIRFEVTDHLKDGENVLHVHIKSTMDEAFKKKYNQYLITYHTEPLAHIRKPAHSYGWDIFPRTVSAGLWRNVNLEFDKGVDFNDISFMVLNADIREAELRFAVDLDISRSMIKKNVLVRVSGKCGDSTFHCDIKVEHYKIGLGYVTIENPKFWWPYGYGEANVYDMKYEILVDGEIMMERYENLGIRTVELVRTDKLTDKDHNFQFVVNNVPIMAKGSNWVPLDAYHSKDKQKYEKALQLFTDTYCNMIRVWGGGVYEEPEFYDYCDRHGIMVWQDFMMACGPVSMDEETIGNLKQEVEWAVKTLRNHPSIVLWAGDNEVDQNNGMIKHRPGMNKITREIILQIVEENDTARPYLASSPYIPDDCYLDYVEDDSITERHLWGARDYYKADFYKNSKAHFVSETGYHATPCLDSIRKIVDEDKIWPILNEQWSLHSSSQNGSLDRVELMQKQVTQLFGIEPDNIEEFVLASQISQAEAKKFFIERVRIHKPYTTGILWWNMLDGWPQMSDAVVDYFFEKKLAYYYIKQSQQPIAMMMSEVANWCSNVHVVNDTSKDVVGTFKVWDIDSKETLSEGVFHSTPNSNYVVGDIQLMYAEQRFLVLEWEIDNKTYYNHYVSGYPTFEFKQYCKWLKEYKNIILSNE